MRKRVIFAIGLAVATAGCDRFKSSGAPDTSPGREWNGHQGVPAVMAERRAFGRWRSDAGVLGGNRTLWVTLDISGTKDVRVELRGFSARGEAVYATANGTASIDPSGVSVDLRSPPSSLWTFTHFAGTFPTTSRMHVKTKDGREFDFRYAGS